MRSPVTRRPAADPRRASRFVPGRLSSVSGARSALEAGIAAVALVLASFAPALAAVDSEAASPVTRPAFSGQSGPVKVAQATPPSVVIDGPVLAAPGDSAALPVRIAPGAKARGRYVVVLKSPEWLSFRGGEQIGSGMWLLEREKLDSVRMVFSPKAAGEAELSLGVGGKTGAIDGVVALRVAVGPTASTPPPSTGPANERSEAIQAPAPVAATRVAQAAPADPPAPTAPGGFTWEKLIGGDKPAAAPAQPAPAKPAAPTAASAKSEADLIQEAKHLVRECTTCHNLYGQDVGIPVMVGLTVDRFLDTMDLYRREKRDHKLMQVISKSLSEEETKALALYLSRIKPASPSDVSGGSGGAMARMPAAETQVTSQQPMTVAKRELDDKTRDRLGRWLKRGETMLNAGDIAQARLLLERASEFGDARAAFLLGQSFDPNALPWRSNIGMVAEPLKARRWYLLAKSLGAGDEADQRLADLPVPR